MDTVVIDRTVFVVVVSLNICDSDWSLFVYLVVAVIIPENFEAILRQYITQGLPDLSVSRPRTRIPWGIPVPGDDTQTVSNI